MQILDLIQPYPKCISTWVHIQLEWRPVWYPAPLDHNTRTHARGSSPPMTGRLAFSDRDTTVGSCVGHSMSMSRKLLCGATTSTGASFRLALRPLTFTHRKPREKKTARLSKQMNGWKNQLLHPLMGRARSSLDRPAVRSGAMSHMRRKNKMAKRMRGGTSTMPKMRP